MSAVCKAQIKGSVFCESGFKQNRFCMGVGLAARLPEDTSLKLRKEVWPACLWDDDVTPIVARVTEGK